MHRRRWARQPRGGKYEARATEYEMQSSGTQTLIGEVKRVCSFPNQAIDLPSPLKFNRENPLDRLLTALTANDHCRQPCRQWLTPIAASGYRKLTALTAVHRRTERCTAALAARNGYPKPEPNRVSTFHRVD